MSDISLDRSSSIRKSVALTTIGTTALSIIVVPNATTLARWNDSTFIEPATITSVTSLDVFDYINRSPVSVVRTQVTINDSVNYDGVLNEGENADFLIVLKNDAPYRITVTDLGDGFSPVDVELAPGQEAAFRVNKTATAADVNSGVIRVNATPQGYVNSELNSTFSSAPVVLTAATSTTPVSSGTLTLEAPDYWVQGETATGTITVTNTGSEDLTNVVIRNKDGIPVATIPSLPATGQTRVEVDVDMVPTGNNNTFNFTATGDSATAGTISLGGDSKNVAAQPPLRVINTSISSDESELEDGKANGGEDVTATVTLTNDAPYPVMVDTLGPGFGPTNTLMQPGESKTFTKIIPTNTAHENAGSVTTAYRPQARVIIGAEEVSYNGNTGNLAIPAVGIPQAGASISSSGPDWAGDVENATISHTVTNTGDKDLTDAVVYVSTNGGPYVEHHIIGDLDVGQSVSFDEPVVSSGYKTHVFRLSGRDIPTNAPIVLGSSSVEIDSRKPSISTSSLETDDLVKDDNLANPGEVVTGEVSIYNPTNFPMVLSNSSGYGPNNVTVAPKTSVTITDSRVTTADDANAGTVSMPVNDLVAEIQAPDGNKAYNLGSVSLSMPANSVTAASATLESSLYLNNDGDTDVEVTIENTGNDDIVNSFIERSINGGPFQVFENVGTLSAGDTQTFEVSETIREKQNMVFRFRGSTNSDPVLRSYAQTNQTVDGNRVRVVQYSVASDDSAYLDGKVNIGESAVETVTLLNPSINSIEVAFIENFTPTTYTLAPGEEKVFTYTKQATSADITNGSISINANFGERILVDGRPVFTNNSIGTTVIDTAPLPVAEGSIVASTFTPNVLSGDSFDISAVMSNTGNGDMEDVYFEVYRGNNLVTTSQSISSVAAGESRSAGVTISPSASLLGDIEYTIKMIGTNVVTGQRLEMDTDTVTVSIKKVGATLSTYTEDTTVEVGEDTVFEHTIKNVGNTNLTDLKLYRNSGDGYEFEANVPLNAGDSTSIRVTVPHDSLWRYDVEHKFEIRGTNPVTGQEQILAQTSEVIRYQQVAIQFASSEVMQYSLIQGDATSINFTISNTGTETIYGARVFASLDGGNTWKYVAAPGSIGPEIAVSIEGVLGYADGWTAEKEVLLELRGQLSGQAPRVFAEDVAGNVFYHTTWDVIGPHLNRQRTSSFAESIGNGKIAIFGGNSNSAVDNFEIYDTVTGNTTLHTNYANHRFGMSSDYYNGKVYLVGGWTGTSSLNTSPAVSVYNVSSDSWSSLPNMPVGLKDTSSVVRGGRLYVIGGRDSSDITQSNIYSISLSNPSAGWRLESTTPIPSYNGESFVMSDNKILTVGNAEGKGMIYDPDTGATTMINIPNAGLTTMAAAQVGDKIYFTAQFINRTYVFDYNTMQSTEKSAMEFPAPYASMHYVNGKLYILGGGGAAGRMVQSIAPSDQI